MAEPIITQEILFEMLEKLPDGTFKRKFPKTKAEQIVGDIDADLLGGFVAADYARPITGSFTGDGTNLRQITLGFRPSLVILVRKSSPAELRLMSNGGGIRVTDSDPGVSYFLAQGGSPEINSNGFRLYTNENEIGKSYNYLAF